MIGDRYLTDIVFGNKWGMLTFRCQVITHSGDNWTASKARSLESNMLKRYTSKGIAAPSHTLLEAAGGIHACNIIKEEKSTTTI